MKIYLFVISYRNYVTVTILVGQNVYIYLNMSRSLHSTHIQMSSAYYYFFLILNIFKHTIHLQYYAENVSKFFVTFSKFNILRIFLFSI